VQSSNFIATKQHGFLHNNKKVFEINAKQEKFQPEKEFEIILKLAIGKDVSDKNHYVNRVRKMRFIDANNFYTFAAETVVACFSVRRSKLEKYHSIYLHLEKARNVVNNDSPKEVETLQEIEKIADSVVDIFDY